MTLPRDDTLFPKETLRPQFRQLPDAFYSDVAPEAVGEDPILVHVNRAILPRIGMSPEAADTESFIELMAGHRLVAGAEPYAAVYAGHQFGHFVPQLGDGRAVTIAEGETDGQPWELQLKGAGRTPYSRFGDGRAVLRSVLREYLCSEHMAALGIPTTRAVSVIASREGVHRETLEPGAVMGRLAPSHIRFGHFEYLHHRGETERVRELADHVLTHLYPALKDRKNPYAALFEEVTARTAKLIAQWQAAGFAHGVMNTDNMSILGLTIDYGPFGFLDLYDPSFICNHSDEMGRYTFSHQPGIAFWNLKALAVAFTSLVPIEKLSAALESYGPAFDAAWIGEMRRKLGLEVEEEGDFELAASFLKILEETKADYTNSWRSLGYFLRGEEGAPSAAPLEGSDWAAAWQARLEREEVGREEIAARLDVANPRYVLRNWVAETAIRAVEDDFNLGRLDEVFRIMTSPFDPHEGNEDMAAPPPAEMCGLSVSCSS
ncbi:YdiU family protein [Parvularcula marina]|uniref:protein adenylyltransferase SelO n=1 Tax=Parvularcula marina TaxID=2292771 RepID=UPI003512CE4D